MLNIEKKSFKPKELCTVCQIRLLPFSVTTSSKGSAEHRATSSRNLPSPLSSKSQTGPFFPKSTTTFCVDSYILQKSRNFPEERHVFPAQYSHQGPTQGSAALIIPETSATLRFTTSSERYSLRVQTTVLPHHREPRLLAIQRERPIPSISLHNS